MGGDSGKRLSHALSRSSVFYELQKVPEPCTAEMQEEATGRLSGEGGVILFPFYKGMLSAPLRYHGPSCNCSLS